MVLKQSVSLDPVHPSCRARGCDIFAPLASRHRMNKSMEHVPIRSIKRKPPSKTLIDQSLVEAFLPDTIYQTFFIFPFHWNL